MKKINFFIISAIFVFLIFAVIFYIQHSKEKSEFFFFFYTFESITKILQTEDKNFVIAGKTSDFGVFLAKINQDGAMLWKHKFGGFNRYSELPIITNDNIIVTETKKQDLIVAINSEITISNTDKEINKIRLIKINKYGKYFYWDKLFGNKDESTHISDILSLQDGGFILLFDIINITDERLFSKIIKFDSNAKVVWQRSFFSKIFNTYLQKIYKTDNGFVIIGDERDITKQHTPYQPVIIKLDKDGKIVSKKHTNYTFTEDNTFIKTNNGYAFISRNTARLNKLDKNGKLLFEKDLNDLNTTSISVLRPTNDGGFIVAGFDLNCKQKKCSIVMKLDKNGNKVWKKRIGGKYWDKENDIIETKEDFVIAGSNLFHNKKETVAWVVKLKK